MSEVPPKFTIEQSARLNPLVDETIPLTWQVRWRTLKLCLPLIVFSSVCFAEMIFIHFWFADEMAGLWLRLVFGFLFPPLLVMAVLEVEVRIRHRMKRRLTLKKRGLVFQPGDRVCYWKSFAGFRFTSIPEQPQLKRCVVLGFDRRKEIVEWPKWSLALDAERQQALMRALSIYRPAGLGDVRIDEPASVESSVHLTPFFLKAMTVYMLGLYLLLHGIPLIGVFYDAERPRRTNRNSDFIVAERRANQIGQFVNRHFHTMKEFRAWGLWSGTGLVMGGLAGIVVGALMFRRSN